MAERDLKLRTKQFSISVVDLCRKLPGNYEGRRLADQLFRSSTSVAANYRAACRARSVKEFIAKLGIVEEEADESLFWMELIEELKLVKPEDLKTIRDENQEILSIIVASIKTAKKRK